jgi:gluconate 5-dehydrogenase
MEAGLFDLSGKTALVTGGSRGIGFAMAKALAEYGADIAIVARDEARLKSAKERIQKSTSDRNVWTFPFDLEDIDGIQSLFENVVRETEGVDILVNCAGTTARAPAEQADLDSWQRVIQVNLTAVFLISQAFCRHRKQVARPGKIINIGSLLCQAARATNAPYASSKGGLLMLTKSLAVEWAKYHINVNAIGPGYIQTELTKPLWTDQDFDKWVLSKTPLGRWGKPEDIVGTAVFLASPASDFVTGQIVYVDGGWLAML